MNLSGTWEVCTESHGILKLFIKTSRKRRSNPQLRRKGDIMSADFPDWQNNDLGARLVSVRHQKKVSGNRAAPAAPWGT